MQILIILYQQKNILFTHGKSDVHVMRNTCTVVVVMVTRCQFLFIVIGPGIGDMPREGFLQERIKNICFSQDAAKPVSDLDFPSVTICSSGLNMEAVKSSFLLDKIIIFVF